VSPPRWLRAVVSWAVVGPSESEMLMNGGDVKMQSKVGTNGGSAGASSRNPRYNRRYSTSRLRRTTVIDEARSSKDGTRAWGIAKICLAKGLAGRAGSMPRNVAWASVSSTSGRVSSRAHAGAHVEG